VSGGPPATPADEAVVLRGVSKAFVRRQHVEQVLNDIDLSVARGEFFVLVGPSGSGKSTILRLIAGFVAPTAGEVRGPDGRPIVGPGRDRGMVFQSVDAPLFEWLTVAENVEFGLRMIGLRAEDRRARTDRLVGMVGLRGHERKFPGELSGGMKQRVQIARALAVDPQVILMDEPFAALDAQTRRIMQREIVRIWADTRKTIVYVTHDIREAVLLGERVGVLTAGPGARIKRVYPIALPYPRDDASADFARLYREIDHDIEVEVTAAWARAGTL
jgi:NitT/TauT family transport system ATP-binding protein